MIKLIIFITKSEIFAYDMSDMTAPVQIGFEGNESVQLSDSEPIESCCSCIIDSYNIDDFSDDDFDFVIIDCNARKKYIPEFAKKVQTCRKMSVYPLEKLIVPALINSSRLPEDTAYVSYREFTYKVYSSEGVLCTEPVIRNVPADIILTEADFSFVFNFRESSAHSSAADVKTAEDTAQLAELNAEIEKLTEKLAENERTISELQSEIAEKNEALEHQASRAAYTDNNELKEKLRELMGEMLPLDDYAVESSFYDEKNFFTVIHTATDFRISFSVGQSESEDNILKMLKTAIINLNEQTKMSLSPYAALSIGDTFEFGRYKDKPILWRVLDKENGILKVVSEDVICERPFDCGKSPSFENSELEQWLNGVFYRSSFSENEKQYIRNRYISILNMNQVTLLFDDKESRNTKSKKDYFLCDAPIENKSLMNTYYVPFLIRNGEIIPDGKYFEPKGIRPYFELIYDAEKATLYEKAVIADDLEALEN